MSESLTPGITRNFTEIAVPGISSPELVSGIVIPEINKPAEKSSLAYTQQRLRAKTRLREESLEEVDLENVQFDLYSTEEIDKYTVVNIFSTDQYGPGTVRDLKMGPHTENQLCDTCSSDIQGCPGHYGKIIIPRLMHPLCVNIIAFTLTCVCNSCGALYLTKENIEAAGLHRMKRTARLQAMAELTKRSGVKCRNADTLGCDPNPTYEGPSKYRDDYRLRYYYGSERGSVYFRYPDVPVASNDNSIYKILNAISKEDAMLMGFKNSHPRNMIMERFIVIPYCARPDVYQDDKLLPDDLTYIYKDILTATRLYYEAGNKESVRESAIRDIYWKISRFMSNHDKKYTQGNVKVLTDIKKRIQGKTAIIRSNTMGKRVNYAGRTVVGPGPRLRVDEIGVPRLMAIKLTRPVKVSELNRQQLQERYDSGKVTHMTMINGPLAGSRVMVTDSLKAKFPDYKLNLGDEVERILEDGDLVLVNRQPTLRKQNILALKAVITDERIIRINLSITTPLNADFDGDEVNIHVPQTVEAYTEAEQLLSVYRNIMSPEANKPVMGLVYDTPSGMYMLTKPQDDYDKLLETNPDSPDLETLRQKTILDPVVYDLSMANMYSRPQYSTLQERLNKHGIEAGTGRALISAAFPEDFFFDKHYPSGRVLVQDGVLIRGTLTAKVASEIIAEMVKQLGGLVTVDFMSDIQPIVRDYLQQHGLSVGYDDYIPADPNFRSTIEEILNNASLKVISLGPAPSDPIMAEKHERKIVETLENAKASTEEVVGKYTMPDNAVLIMSSSGAKGSALNTVQMTSALGQQKVSGKRIKANLSGNRSLPIFEPNSLDPRARGFVYNSFSSGLDSSEFFFHAQGGREGLTDTAISTADTGNLQHQIIKAAEDITVAADGSIRTPDMGIVEFVYGGDGFTASELTDVNIDGDKVPFFRNISILAHRINEKYV